MSEQPQASAGRKRFCQLLAQLAQEHDRLEAECQSLRWQGGAPARKAPVAELPEESEQLDLPTDVRPCVGDVMGEADTGQSGSLCVAVASRRVVEDMGADASEPTSGVDGADEMFGLRHLNHVGKQGMKCTLVSIGDALEEVGPKYDAAVAVSNEATSSGGVANEGVEAPTLRRMLSKITGHELEEMTDEWMEQRHIEALGPVSPQRGILSPIGRMRIAWEVLWCLALCFDLWQVPFRIIFCSGSFPDVLERVSLVVNAFFLADIIMNFNTGYIDHDCQLLVMNRRRIAINYLTSWFPVDFISSLPWEYLDSAEFINTFRALKVSKVSRAFRVMRSLKLVRAVKIVRTVKNWSRLSIVPLYQVDLRTPTVVHRLFGERMGRRYELARDTCVLPIQALFLLAMLAHFFGCVRGAVLQAAHESYWDALDTFLECFPWAYSLLTFGSAAQPASPAGRWLQLSVLTVRGALAAAGAFWFAFAAILFHQHNTGFHVHNESVARCLRTRGVGPNTQMSVMRHLEATGPARGLRDHFHQVVENFLPKELRMSIREEMWVPRLMSLGLIREIASWSDLFVGQLAQLVQEELYASHAVVFKHGDVASVAYQIFDGSVVIMALAFDDPNVNPPPFTSGMWLGEKALISPGLRRATLALTTMNTTLLSLPSAGFASLLEAELLTERFQDFCAEQLWRGLCGRCGLLGDHFGNECPLIAGGRSRVWSLRRVVSMGPRGSTSSNSLGLQVSQERTSSDLRLFLKRQDMAWLEPELVRLEVTTLEQLRQMDASRLETGLCTSGHDITQEHLESIAPHAIEAFLADVASEFKSRVREAQRDDGYLLFLSHYKVEAGTEAALMRTELEQILGESGLANDSGVFLDSEDLTTLVDLQDAVRKSKNIVVLLTASVLTRPWVLVELATAYKAGVPVLTVLLSKQGDAFTYPSPVFFESLLDGSLLGGSGTEVIQESGFDMATVVAALKAVLQRISLPYSPHRPASIRRAELCALIQQCTLHDRKVRGADNTHASGWLARAKRLRKSDTWEANLLTKG